MNIIKHCRVPTCGVELVVGVNWLASQTKRNEYICRGCNSLRVVAWQKKHPDRHAAKARSHYRGAPKASFYTRAARRRAHKALCVSATCPQERAQIAALYDEAQMAAAFMGQPFHVDHREPLSKGHSNTLANLQVLPASMNCSKSDLTHEQALDRVAGYREWAEGPASFESITITPPSPCRECLLAVGLR